MTVRQVLPERERAVDGWEYGFRSDPSRRPDRVIPDAAEPITRPEPVIPSEPAARSGRHRGSHRTGPIYVGSGSHRARRHGRLTSVAVLGLVGTVAGGGLVGVGYLASHTGPAATTGALALHAAAVSSLSAAGNVDGAATAMPGMAAVPQFAFAPSASATGKKTATRKASRSAKARASASPTPSLAASSALPSPSGKPSPTAAPTRAPTSAAPTPKPSSPTASAPAGNGGAAACTNPVFTTTGQYGTYTDVPYYVANDMWNVGSANASQTLDVCSHSDFSVTANISGGGNGVKTYPNAQRDFSNAPAISSLNSVTSTFTESIPESGTFETAYDIWLNAVANPSAGSDEVMIWTNNHGQIPGGSPQGTVTFDGVTYTAWKGDGNYFAFVANSAFTSGSLNLLDFFKWLMSQNWIPGNSTLVQVDYGVEVVSTNGPETFSFNNFSVDAS